MSLAGLLNQTITLASKTSYGHDGRPAFSAGVSVKSRFENITKRILLPDGTTLTIDARAIVLGDATVATDDKVTYDGAAYKVVDIFKVPGGNGDTHHQELRLIKWPST